MCSVHITLKFFKRKGRYICIRSISKNYYWNIKTQSTLCSILNTFISLCSAYSPIGMIFVLIYIPLSIYYMIHTYVGVYYIYISIYIDKSNKEEWNAKLQSTHCWSIKDYLMIPSLKGKLRWEYHLAPLASPSKVPGMPQTIIVFLYNHLLGMWHPWKHLKAFSPTAWDNVFPVVRPGEE